MLLTRVKIYKKLVQGGDNEKKKKFDDAKFKRILNFKKSGLKIDKYWIIENQ